MRTLKKTLALVLVVAMMMSLCITASAFDDADEITYVEAVEVLNAIGVVNGMDEDTFDPTGTLTRAQAAAIITRLLGDEAYAVAKSDFTDCVGHWADSYIAYCAAKGIVDGYGDGTFGPNDVLTGYQFAKMLLVALGSDADYTGSAWEIAVASDAAEYGLFKGNLKADKTKAATREEACLYALNALTYSETPAIWEVVDGDGDVIGEFDNAVDAALTAKLLGEGYSVKEADAVDTLLKTVHKVTKTTGDVDAFGNPGTSYYRIPAYGYINNFYPYGAVASYTEGFDAKELKALKADYDFDAVVYVNGEETELDADELADRDYVGTTVNLYDVNGDYAIERIVVEQGYMTVIDTVKSNYKTASNNYVSIIVYNPWGEYQHGNFIEGFKPGKLITYNNTASNYDMYDYLCGYAEGDALITYWNGANIDDEANLLDWEEAASEVVTIKSTKHTGGTTYAGTFTTTDGETYTLASGYNNTPLNIGKEYAIYFDAAGYVIGAVSTEGEVFTIDHYALVLDYATANGTSASNVTGAAAKEAYENVLLLTSDGKEVVLSTEYELDAKGINITEHVGEALWAEDTKNFNTDLKGALVVYELNAAGEISSLELADSSDYELNHAKKGALVKLSGETYATDATVIFVEDEDGKVVVYTGYASLPEGTYAEEYVAIPMMMDSGAVKYTVDEHAGAYTDAQFAVVLAGTASVEATDKEGVFKYTYSAVVDGELTEIYQLDDASHTAPTAGVISTVMFDAKTGAAILTPVTSTNAEIDDVYSGYYTYDSAADPQQTDKDTVYCQLSYVGSIANVTGWEIVDTIPVTGFMDDSFTTHEYFVAETEGIADIVFFYIIEK